MPAIQVVLFDLGGTLLHYEQPPEHTFEAINNVAIHALLDAAVDAGARVPDMEQAVRAVNRMAAAMEAKAARTHHANTAEGLIRDGLEAVHIQLSDSAWDAGLKAYYAQVSEVVKPVDGDARAVLSQLQEQGRGLGLVSNSLWTPEIHDEDLTRFGLIEYLPVRVYSSAAGIIKPHPAIYRQALDRFDVAPAEAVFVGDKLAVDIAGPQKIGMRAVLVTSPYHAEEDPDIQPDARIASLDELPALLADWERDIEEQMSEASGQTEEDEG